MSEDGAIIIDALVVKELRAEKFGLTKTAETKISFIDDLKDRGIDQVVTIEDGLNLHTLTFELGLLTAYTEVLLNNFSMDFDGVDEYINIPDDASLGITNNVSYSVWFKAPAQSAKPVIAQIDFSIAERQFYIRSANNISAPNSRVEIFVDSDGTYTNKKVYASSIDVFDNTWHHVVMTFTTNDLKLYIDGIEDTSVIKTEDDTVNTIYDADTPLLIGSMNPSSGQSYFDGNIDDVSIWDKELTEQEILEIYNGGIPNDLSIHSAAANIISWWKMGDGATYDGTNWTIPDEIGSNTGTSVNMELGDRVADVPA